MLRLLVACAVLVVVVYFVSTRVVNSVTAIGEGAGEEVGGRKLGYSPFRITFKDQYLCYSFDDGEWVMQGHHTGDDCHGPFIDSATLCRAMEQEGVSRVTLFWEGRVLECN